MNIMVILYPLSKKNIIFNRTHFKKGTAMEVQILCEKQNCNRVRTKRGYKMIHQWKKRISFLRFCIKINPNP